MTLDDVARTLPNGFHDAEVHTLAIDFGARVAVLQLDIWVGEVDTPVTQGLDAYRPARLELRGLAYLASAPPDARYEYAKPGTLRVDLCDADPADPVPPVRAGDFAAKFFVASWNAFISVSAREAILGWTGSVFHHRHADKDAPASRPRPGRGRPSARRPRSVSP